MSTTKINPDVFLMAAEMIDAGKGAFACNAIKRIGGEAGSKEITAAELALFTELFFQGAVDYDPRRIVTQYGGWFHLPYSEWSALSDAGMCRERSHRIFALLLAYEVANEDAKRAALRARWRKNSAAYRARRPRYRMLAAGEIIAKGDECIGILSGIWQPSSLIGCTVWTCDVGSYRRPLRTQRKAGK